VTLTDAERLQYATPSLRRYKICSTPGPSGRRAGILQAPGESTGDRRVLEQLHELGAELNARSWRARQTKNVRRCTTRSGARAPHSWCRRSQLPIDLPEARPVQVSGTFGSRRRRPALRQLLPPRATAGRHTSTRCLPRTPQHRYAAHRQRFLAEQGTRNIRGRRRPLGPPIPDVIDQLSGLVAPVVYPATRPVSPRHSADRPR